MSNYTPTLPNGNPLPVHVQERTFLAQNVLGLSKKEQVTRPRSRHLDQVSRIRRLRRVVKGAADQLSAAHQRAGMRYRCAMVTLTYAPDVKWEARHITGYIKAVRQWLARRGHPMRYVWVAELQQRGAIHYHVLIWLPRGLTLPKPDKRGHWPHGSTRIEWARRPVGYLAKYATKLSQRAGGIPRGTRIYGVGGCPIHLGWWRAPGWLREIADRGMTVRQRAGGWWCVEETAWAWRSPWRLVRVTESEIEVEWVGWRPSDIQPIAIIERA